MKQFIGLILLALALTSCNDEITNVYVQESSSSVESLVSSSSVAILRSSSSSEIEVPLSSAFIESSSSELFIESSSSLIVVSSSSLVVSSSSSVALSSSSVAVSSSSIVVESSSSSIEYGTLTDARDGQTYKTVKIGTQIWMAQNLNYEVKNSWCYQNNSVICSSYGRLYQWAAAMRIASTYNDTAWGGSDVNHKGICPEGWHIPNNDDWQTLSDYVGANNGEERVSTSLKSTSGWEPYSGVAIGTNRFGFYALPAGYRYDADSFYNAGNNAVFRSATEYTEYEIDGVFFWGLSSYDEDFYYVGNDNKNSGFSVRCLKN